MIKSSLEQEEYIPPHRFWPDQSYLKQIFLSGMAGTVFLRTNRFEVKLQGINYKAKDFEQLCNLDFLFPEGKVWVRPPVVGLDVMRHPRNPDIVLLLLCFGVGCVILRFRSGQSLPQAIVKFLTDDRIRFAGFGIPEKKDLFPFQELGLTKNKTDIGYLAAKILNDPRYAQCQLPELALEVLGVKEMVGLTDGSSFNRREQIKCAICQLFMSTVIAMSLLRPANSNTSSGDAPRKIKFRKTFNSLPLLNEGWYQLAKGTQDYVESSQVLESLYDLRDEVNHDFVDDSDQAISNEEFSSDDSFLTQSKGGDFSDEFICVKKGGRASVTNNIGGLSNESNKEESSPSEKPLKGILKCLSTRTDACPSSSSPPTSPQSPKKEQDGGPSLKSVNSKGCNVTFKQ